MFTRARRFTPFRRAFRRFSVRGAGSTRAAAFKAWRGVKALKRVSNAEIKTLITDTSSSPTTTATITALSQIAQGDDLNNRQGRSVRVTGWKLWYDIRGSDETAAGNTSGANTLRMIIFADNGQDGVTPTAAELMNSTQITSAINPSNSKRFTILMDRLLFTGPPGSVAAADVTGRRTNRVVGTASGVHGKHVRYIGTSAAEASNGLGSIYMFLLASEDAEYQPLALTTFELKFVDN